MLAGLLFAIHDTDDRPDRLSATLPFGGVTLIEYQARLLIAAGASQIIVFVSRLTPELLGALSRIGKRGVAIDAVRSAAEAVQKMHPLARVLMLADGLITTQSVVDTLAGEGRDALLVVEDSAAGVFERVGGQLAWAGVARLDPRRIAEVAALPSDYDPQSSLVRVASQAQAVHLALPLEALKHGHGIEHQARALEERGRIVLASIVSTRRGWFDRLVVSPVARLILPLLIARGVPGGAIGAGSTVFGLGGLGLIWFGYFTEGVLFTLVAVLGLAIGATLAELRDEPRLARFQVGAATFLPGLAVPVIGWVTSTAAFILALAAVGLGALGERAATERANALWWGTPAAFLALLIPFMLVSAAVAGLAVIAVYAFLTLAAKIERMRDVA